LAGCLQSTDGTSLAGKCGAAIIHVVLTVMAYYSTRIETAGHLSTWIGLQLLAKQRTRMGEILNKLLPPDMVDLVLAQHFQQGNEPLPIKVPHIPLPCPTYCSRAPHTAPVPYILRPCPTYGFPQVDPCVLIADRCDRCA